MIAGTGWRLLLFAAALMLFSPQTLQARDAPAASGNEAALVRVLEALVARPGGPPGAMVLLWRDGQRRVYTAGRITAGCRGERAGRAGHCAARRPARPADRLRIASVSKAFSGAAALALVSDGRLGLDDTIGERLPELPRRWHAVTLRQLLNHTSGLPDFTGTRAFARRVIARPMDPPAPRELLAFAAHRPLQFRPGSRYRYSNSDNIAVGLMIEAVAGRSYPKVLRQKVLRPLGLGRTGLRRGVALPRPFINGYARDGDRLVDVSEEIAFGGYAWASGGMVSSPGNLGRFVRAYVGGGLFDGAVRREQFRFVPGASSKPPGPGRNAAGLGLFRYRTPCGTVYGHTGSILGYTHFVAATRDGRTSIVFSINAQAGEDLIPMLRKAQTMAVCAALVD